MHVMKLVSLDLLSGFSGVTWLSRVGRLSPVGRVRIQASAKAPLICGLPFVITRNGFGRVGRIVGRTIFCLIDLAYSRAPDRTHNELSAASFTARSLSSK